VARFLHIVVNLGEKRVIVKGLLVNAITRQVNFISLSAASSSSSSNGTYSSWYFWLLEDNLFLLLRFRFFFKVLQVGAEADPPGWGGESSERR
jgi:hypothetical protein